MKKWLIPIFVIAVSGAVAFLFLQDRVFNVESLNETDAIAHIESLYNGRVEHIEKNAHYYEAQLSRKGATYEVAIDANTHQITGLTLKEGAVTPFLTEAEIRKLLANYTSSEIESITLKDKYYDVKIRDENAIKTLTMDVYTGEILSETETIKEVVEPSSVETVISKKQAIQIALKKLKGEVDSVDYEETEEGGYYLIEIETEDEEAVFQIHAVSGKVMSVAWD